MMDGSRKEKNREALEHQTQRWAMPNVSLKKRGIFALGTSCIAGTAGAQGLFENGRFVVGAGVGYSAGIYKGQKSETGAIPFIAYESERLSVGFEGISYAPVKNENLTFSIKLAPGFKPDYPKNNPLYQGLKRETAIELGFDATYEFEAGYVSGSFMHDVSSKHKGYHLEAKLGTDFDMGSVNVDIGIGGRLRDAKLNNYLYGVSAGEATANRAAYRVGRTIEPFIDMSVTMPITERAAIVGMIEYQALSKKVSKSPLVGRKNNYSVGLGLIYQF